MPLYVKVYLIKYMRIIRITCPYLNLMIYKLPDMNLQKASVSILVYVNLQNVRINPFF